MEPLDLTVTQAARSPGVGRQALSSLLNEKASALASDMALRIEKAFGDKVLEVSTQRSLILNSCAKNCGAH
jgi:plasmid maintenance system antidote protein VapI